MLTEKTPRKISVSAGGTDFTFDFPIWADTDLLVYVKPTSGVDTLQVLDTDYTLSYTPGDEAGGTVSFLVAVTSGYTVTALRESPAERTSDLARDSLLISGLNVQLDRILALAQEVREGVARSFKTAVSDSSAVPTFSGTRTEGDCLAWDASGNLTSVSVDAAEAQLAAIAADDARDNAEIAAASAFSSAETATAAQAAIEALNPIGGAAVGHKLVGFRCALLDGGAANTIRIYKSGTNYQNAVDFQTLDIAKNDNGTYFALNAGGTVLTIKAAAFGLTSIAAVVSASLPGRSFPNAVFVDAEATDGNVVLALYGTGPAAQDLTVFTDTSDANFQILLLVVGS